VLYNLKKVQLKEDFRLTSRKKLKSKIYEIFSTGVVLKEFAG